MLGFYFKIEIKVHNKKMIIDKKKSTAAIKHKWTDNTCYLVFFSHQTSNAKKDGFFVVYIYTNTHAHTYTHLIYLYVYIFKMIITLAISMIQKSKFSHKITSNKSCSRFTSKHQIFFSNDIYMLLLFFQFQQKKSKKKRSKYF